MTKVLATAADAGRPCPYCHFPLKEGVAAERCDSCNSLHHEDCWRDGGGCAVLGCVEAGTATAGSVGPAGQQYTAAAPIAPQPMPISPQPPQPISPQPPPTHAYPGYGQAPGYGPASGYPPPPSRWGISQVVLVIAVAIALLGVGTGVVVATGVLSGGTASGARATGTVRGTVSTSTTPRAPATPVGPTVPEREGDRSAIMSLLDGYQGAYSQHDVSALSHIFSPQISRHGLAAGGCTVSHGRGAVLNDYQSQFEQGSGSYELVGLSSGEIQIESKTRAHLDAHYQITPGGTGYVNFRFAELGEGWKISEVYATCD